ncbi:MAG: restriction endonuclease subunit S [Verrucomicrobiota bacterium]
MEVKPGYKQTEVGIIPEEWEVKLLADVAEVRGGIAKNSNVAISDPISVYYLRVANVQDGYLDLAEMSRIQMSRQDLKRFTVLPGDVLMNEGGDMDQLGRGAMWEGQFDPCVHQNHVFVVRCRPVLRPEFLNIWTGTRPARRFFLLTGKQTTNLASISKSSLGELPVAVPPLPEQRAIATALSDVDGLLGGLDRLIAKKRDLKQAAMQQLLTGQTRLPGFHGEWEVKRLGQISWFQEGPGLRDWQFTNSGMKVINVTNLENGVLNLERTERHISLSEFNRMYQHFAVDAGDIVMASSGNSYGKAAVVRTQDLPLVMNTSVIRFKPVKKTDYGFLWALLTSPLFKSQIELMITGGAQPNFGPYHLERVNFPAPPFLEQTAIASVLMEMDGELTVLEQRREKTRALKQAMMQELLTGRIRLL